MTYTAPSRQDFDGHVIRGEWSLRRYSNRESQRQSQSVCLVLQSALSVNETMWSAAQRGEESRKGDAKQQQKNQPLNKKKKVGCLARSKLRDEKEHVSIYFWSGCQRARWKINASKESVLLIHREEISKGGKLCFKVLEMLNH